MRRLSRPTVILAFLAALFAAAVGLAVFLIRRRAHRNPAIAGTAALLTVWVMVHV
jgi:hypothetical protein